MVGVGSDPMMTVVPASRAERRRAKNVPGWMSVAVVAAGLAGGAWLLYWFVAGSGPRERTVTFSEVPRQARRGEGGGPVSSVFRQLARTTDGVLVVRADEWRVKSGDAVMNVAKQKDGTLGYTFYYDRSDLVPPEQLALLVVRRDVVNDADAALALGITPQQLETFKRQQGETGMSIAPAERKELAGLWAKYVAADAGAKPAAEKQLVAALDVVGKRNLDVTKQRMIERAKLVESTLTPEQLERVRQRSRQVRRR